MRTDYQFLVVIERDEDGVYFVSCPALQDCYSEGDTYEEALENIREAIEGHIEARRLAGEPVPHFTESMVAQVKVAA